jgi:MYXO-CTERM domain-containing protein
MTRTLTSLSRLGGLAALAMLSVAAGEPDARACGGCFHGPPAPQQSVTVINDHRMVFSISTAQTVLWDQIEYSGQASEFAWVLPVKAGARIELSQDAWMASLEASTQTVIQAPVNNCGIAQSQDVGGPSGGGCMGSSANAEFAAAPAEADSGVSEDGGSPVQVITQQVVGPYDSVTVRSSQGEALNAWLQANGYDVPASVQPVIDAFTTQGFDFIALKLAPGEGVQAMQPVRVVTPGADLSLPLRMVAAGVGAHVGLELFVLSEGAYQPQNFPLATIDFSQLKWDPNNVISNYTTLAAQALATNGGKSWLVETSGPANLGGGFSSGGNPALDTTYESTCVQQTLPPPPSCNGDAGGGDSATVPPTTDGGASDGASPSSDGGGGTTEGGSPANDAGADAAACQPTVVGCDDLDVAMTGITPGNLWITRLRADLPATALSDDLVLEASPSQVQVPSFHQATQYTIPNYDPCSGQNQASSNSQQRSAGACACRTTDAAPVGGRDLALLAVAGLGAVLSVRRRRRV